MPSICMVHSPLRSAAGGQLRASHGTDTQSVLSRPIRQCFFTCSVICVRLVQPSHCHGGVNQDQGRVLRSSSATEILPSEERREKHLPERRV